MSHLSSAVTKNLFLKDKMKKSLWLLCVWHDRQLSLSDVARRLGLGSGSLRLAEEALMLGILRVGQGCASPLTLFCDTQCSIRVLLDRELTHGHDWVYFHPMTNSATMGLRPNDLLLFLKETGHEPLVLSFD